MSITKREQQITDPEQIRAILDGAKVLYLGLSTGDEPYVVPMNYGYALEGGKLVLYLHSGLKGKKLDMIRENPRVYFALIGTERLLWVTEPVSTEWLTPLLWAGERPRS